MKTSKQKTVGSTLQDFVLEVCFFHLISFHSQCILKVCSDFFFSVLQANLVFFTNVKVWNFNFSSHCNSTICQDHQWTGSFSLSPPIFAQSDKAFDKSSTDLLSIPSPFCRLETWDRQALWSHESLFQGGRGERGGRAQWVEIMPQQAHILTEASLSGGRGAELQVIWRPGVSWVVSEVRVVSMTLPGRWRPAPGYRGSSLQSVGELSWRTPAAHHSPSHTPPAPAPTGEKKKKDLVSFDWVSSIPPQICCIFEKWNMHWAFLSMARSQNWGHFIKKTPLSAKKTAPSSKLNTKIQQLNPFFKKRISKKFVKLTDKMSWLCQICSKFI